jgi:dihydrofolate reductase
VSEAVDVKVNLIVAMDEAGCIGIQGALPWRLKSDMARFKRLTEGDGSNAAIMGRKTWDSLPENYRPLPGRLNIVMSRDIAWTADGAATALYVGRAIELAYAEGCEECWVIGGAQIYRMFLERADEFHITTVHTSGSGDVKFPDWYREGWSETVVETQSADEFDEHSTTYSVWKRP